MPVERSPRLTSVDVAIGGVFTALMLGEFTLECCTPAMRPPALIVGLLIVLGLTVTTRNLASFTSFAVNGVAVVATIALGFDGFVYQWTNALCLYTVGERCRPPLSYVGLALGQVGVTAWFLLEHGTAEPVTQAFVMLLWVAGWVAGTQVASRQRELERERAYAAESEARYAAEIRATIAEERAQMARELHDSIGHSVTLMVMQAGAARRSIDRDRSTAVGAIEVVERTGREALGELDRLVGLLHRDNESGDGSAPGLDDLAALVDRTAAGGLQVDLEVDDGVAGVPHAVQLGMFRLAQEALTNTLKHADATRARVTVRVDDGRLIAEVSDDGRGAADSDTQRDGRGLIGLAARIDALGGSFMHGPRPEGGYRVACEIPLS
jgi:signal transduction histidine kinase